MFQISGDWSPGGWRWTLGPGASLRVPGTSTFRKEWAEAPALSLEANLALTGFYQQQPTGALLQQLIKKPDVRLERLLVLMSHLVPAETFQREHWNGPA